MVLGAWVIIPLPFLHMGIKAFLDPDPMEGLIVVISTVLCILLLMEIAKTGLAMPFTMYVNGITERRVSFRKILARQEKFIPWDRVKSVNLTTHRGNPPVGRSVRVYYGYGQIYLHEPLIVKREKRVFRGASGSGTSWIQVEHPNCLRIMRILEKYVPHKLDENSRYYLQSKQE